MRRVANCYTPFTFYFLLFKALRDGGESHHAAGIDTKRKYVTAAYVQDINISVSVVFADEVRLRRNSFDNNYLRVTTIMVNMHR